MKITWGDWKGWEVYIEEKGGARLPEHRVNHYPAKGLEPATTKVFIEYHDGQEFTIYAASSSRNAVHDVSASYAVDGRSLQSSVRSANNIFPFAREHSYETVNGKLWTKTLRFEPLTRVIDGFMVNKELEEQLGTITVNLEYGMEGDCFRDYPYESPPPKSTLNARIKPDTLTSYIGGHELRPTQPVDLVTWTRNATRPQYRIVFHYFTRKTLMAMNVIPNPNTTPLLRSVSEEFAEFEALLRRDYYNARKRQFSEDSDTTAMDDQEQQRQLKEARAIISRSLHTKAKANKKAHLDRSRASSASSDISALSYNLRSRSVTPHGKPNPYRRVQTDKKTDLRVKRQCRRDSTIEIKL